MRAHGDPTAINMSFKQVPLLMVKIVNIIQDFLIHNVNARYLCVTILVSSSVAAVSLNPDCSQSFCSRDSNSDLGFDYQKV
jgi:hypothetical protein